jgi:hypothetical protein
MRQFDKNDRKDVVADVIRQEFASLALKIFERGDFQKLKTQEQIEVMTGGAMTAVMGILFSFIRDTTEGHDAIEEFVSSYVQQARAQAEGIARGQEKFQ